MNKPAPESQPTTLQQSVPRAVLSQLEAILKRDKSADIIGITWPDFDSSLTLESPVTVCDITLHVIYCSSELAIRYELLQQRPAGARLVLLCSLDNSTLAEDIRARLWRQSLRRIDAWQTLIERLELRAIDPRLTKIGKHWFADALLEVWPQIEKDSHLGDVLDHDTAWQALARGWLNFNAAELDADTLFAWSIESPAERPAPSGMLQNIGHWLSPRLGDIAEPVMAALRVDEAIANDDVSTSLASAAKELLPLGLVIQLILTHSQPNESATMLVRLEERYLGRKRPDNSSMTAFGDAAVRFTQRILSQSGAASAAKIQRAMERAQRILHELDCPALSLHSDLLPRGHQLRVEKLATALQNYLSGGSTSDWQQVEDCLRHVNAHQQAESVEQKQRVNVPVALARWLRFKAPELAKIKHAPALMRTYRTNGGFVDFIRARLWSGDTVTKLSDTYELLLAQTREQLEAANERFASDIEGLARGDELPTDLEYVENAIEKLIAPLVRQQPVLMLVMDGMSQAVWRELADNFFHQNWTEYHRKSESGTTDSYHGCSLVAAFPSITKVCRHALFTGQLTQGNSADEQRGFASHPALQSSTSKAAPPVIFHKDKLKDTGKPGLSAHVREVLANEKHQAVAVVVNVIDDQLSSNDQLSSRWGEDSLPLVDQLLSAAREGNRLVVLTSDHGHVRAFESSRGNVDEDPQEGRYKAGTESADDGEVVVAGSRVVNKDNRIVAPWSEQIRYAHPKKGYHGGVSLQEVVIPFAVYGSKSLDIQLDGWREVTQQLPDWWQLQSDTDSTIDPSPEPQQIGKPKKQPAPKQYETVDLFEPVKEIETEVSASYHWIASLLQSPIFVTQKKRAARVNIDDATLRSLLECLDSRGDQAGTIELAEAIDKPARRIPGLIAGARRILNIDGYDILSHDTDSGTVRLNSQQLKVQFGLSEN